MRRRQFIAFLGSSVAGWGVAARAQQQAMPVIGYLNFATPEGFSGYLRALRQGLKESGYVEGENLAIEYRWPLIEVLRKSRAGVGRGWTASFRTFPRHVTPRQQSQRPGGPRVSLQAGG
jgi:hypothetical protein